MDQYLIFIAPYIFIGFAIMLAPFASNRWPDWLAGFVEFCARMSNGVWVAGFLIVVLTIFGVPFPVAAIVGLPVMYFSGEYIAKLGEKWTRQSRDAIIKGGEERRKRESKNIE